MRKTITRAKLIALQAQGHAVVIYPRKKCAVVDGWKYYLLVD